VKKNILKVILNRIAAEAESPGDEGINEQLDALRAPSEGITTIVRDIIRPYNTECCKSGCCRIIYSSLKTVSYADVQDQITPILGLMAGAHGMPPNTPFLPETLTIRQNKTACVSTTKEGCDALKEFWQSAGAHVEGFVPGRACLLRQTIENIAWKDKSCEALNCKGNYSGISLFAFNPFNGSGGEVQVPRTYHEVYHFSEQEYNTFVSQAIMAAINNCVPLTYQQATDLSDAIQYENAMEDARNLVIMSAAMLLLGSAGLIYRSVTGACTAAPAAPFAAAMTKKQIAKQALLVIGADAAGVGFQFYEPEMATLNFMGRMPAQWPISDPENLSNIPFCFIPPNTLDEETGYIVNHPSTTPAVNQNRD